MSEYVQLYDPADLIRMIESYGFRLFVGDDGVVHGKPSKPGVTIPWEMRPLLRQLQMQNETVAALIRTRDADRVELKNLTEEEAQPWLDRVNAGEYRLIGRVTYVKSTKTASFTLEKVVRDDG